MNGKLRVLIAGLALISIFTFGIATIYQYHLRFLMEKWPGLGSPSEVVDFPTAYTYSDENRLVLGGLQLPFSETDIATLRRLPFAQTGIMSTRHLPDEQVLMFELVNGIEVVVTFPKSEYKNPLVFLTELEARQASRADFSWNLKVDEVERLARKLRYQMAMKRVARIALRREALWSGLFRDYSSRVEVEWLTNDGAWNGCVHISFNKAAEYRSNSANQIEFSSLFSVDTAPSEQFDEKVSLLFAKISAKQPTSIKN